MKAKTRKAEREIHGAEIWIRLGVGRLICANKQIAGMRETRRRSDEHRSNVAARYLSRQQINAYRPSKEPPYWGVLQNCIARNNCPMCDSPKKGKYTLSADGVRRLYRKRAERLKK